MRADKWRIIKRRSHSGLWGVFPPGRSRPRYSATTFPQAVRALVELQRRAAR